MVRQTPKPLPGRNLRLSSANGLHGQEAASEHDIQEQEEPHEEGNPEVTSAQLNGEGQAPGRLPEHGIQSTGDPDRQDHEEAEGLASLGREDLHDDDLPPA